MRQRLPHQTTHRKQIPQHGYIFLAVCANGTDEKQKQLQKMQKPKLACCFLLITAVLFKLTLVVI
jgi:hypothetical protein